MTKSINDIREQTARVIALAESLGKYKENAKHIVDVQYIASIAARARAQHGLGLFGNPDEKKPFIGIHEEPKPTPIAEPERPQPHKVVQTPTEKADNRIALNDWLDADWKNRRQLQMACRHRFINKMYAELLTDMEICKMEGWDVLEYPRMIRDAIQVCFPKPKQLTLF